LEGFIHILSLYLSLRFPPQLLRTLLEKIVLQGFADFEQGVGTDVGMAKQPVKVLPCAMHLSCQPSDRPTLSGKLFANVFPYVKLICRRCVFRFCHVKKEFVKNPLLFGFSKL